MAERGGFEPPVQLLTVQRFSKPPPSATRPSLRVSSDYTGIALPARIAATPRPPIALPRFPHSPRSTFSTFTLMRFVLTSRSAQDPLLPLVAATYFMVSGGPYGIEDILGGAGYGWAILILLMLPLLWSLPTALMIGELAAAIPAEGGFYVWVRRGLGPFWGYQESWLSLTASIFDMALYPSIFVLYLGKFSSRAHRRLPRAYSGRSRSSSSAARGICAARPKSATTRSGSLRCCSRPSWSSSRWASGMVSLRIPPSTGAAPLPAWRSTPVSPLQSWSPVELHGLGQRLHHRARGRQSAAQLSARHDRRRPAHRVSLTCFRWPPWRSPDSRLKASPPARGPSRAALSAAAALALAVVAGGMICGVGMFNALMMSYTRLPIAMAADGLLPRVFPAPQPPRRALGECAGVWIGLGAGAQAPLRAPHLH